MGNIWLAFITGLTTGGISCFAVQGGLLASSLTDNANKRKTIALFLTAKIIAHTALGILLGFLGSGLNISPKFQGWLQLVIGIYLLATAARFLNLHPIFRYLVIQPPKQILTLLKNRAQAKSFFTPVVLGLLTIFIPCGVTQAMMLLAMGTGSPIWGAIIMSAFILGTSPVFFLIGLAAAELFRKKAFVYLAAGFIAVLGISAINSGQLLRGSVHTLQNYRKVLVEKRNASRTPAKIKNGVQQATINVYNNGYVSDADTLKINVPVKLTLITRSTKSCARAFTIPKFNIFKILPADGQETLEFTPTEAGILTYTCSMGMYSGSFNIVE